MTRKYRQQPLGDEHHDLVPRARGIRGEQRRHEIDPEQHEHPTEGLRGHDREPPHDEVARERDDEEERDHRRDEPRCAVEAHEDDGCVAVDQPDTGEGRDIGTQHHRDAEEQDAGTDDDEERGVCGQDARGERAAEDDRGRREQRPFLRPAVALGLAFDRPARRAHRSAPAATGVGSGVDSWAASPARTGCQRSIRRPVSEVPYGVERRDVDEHEERGEREPRTPSGGMATKPEADRPESVDHRLADDREAVQRSVVPQRDARCGDDQERDCHQSAQDLVRQELEGIEAEPAGVEQLAGHRDAAQATRHDPDLAAVLAAAGARDRLEGDRLGLEDEPASRTDHLRRRDEIVGDPVGHVPEELAADRVDGTGRRDDAAAEALGVLDEPVEVPVAALTGTDRRGGRRVGDLAGVAAREVDLVAGHAADVGVREGADELADRIRRVRRVRVREHEDLAGRRRDRGVEGARLAGPRQIEDTNAAIFPASFGDRPVGGPVRRDHDLEAVARVIDGQQVLDPGADRAFLVVRGDDHADRRRHVGHLMRPRTQPRAQHDKDRESGVRVADQAAGEPEEERVHAADSRMVALVVGSVGPPSPGSREAWRIRSASRAALRRHRNRRAPCRGLPPQGGVAVRVAREHRASASARAVGSPGGTSRPLTPSVTSSGMPDRRLATTGRPLPSPPSGRRGFLRACRPWSARSGRPGHPRRQARPPRHRSSCGRPERRARRARPRRSSSAVPRGPAHRR